MARTRMVLPRRSDQASHGSLYQASRLDEYTSCSLYQASRQDEYLEMGRSIGWAMSPLPRSTQNKGLAGSLYRLTSTTLRSTDA